MHLQVVVVMYGMAGWGHTPGLPRAGTHHVRATGKVAKESKRNTVRTKAQLHDDGHKYKYDKANEANARRLAMAKAGV